MKKLPEEEDVFIVGEAVFVGTCCSVGPDITVRHIVPSKCVQARGKLRESEDDGAQTHHQNSNTYNTIQMSSSDINRGRAQTFE